MESGGVAWRVFAEHNSQCLGPTVAQAIHRVQWQQTQVWLRRAEPSACLRAAISALQSPLSTRQKYRVYFSCLRSGPRANKFAFERDLPTRAIPDVSTTDGNDPVQFFTRRLEYGGRHLFPGMRASTPVAPGE